jgi:arylsulfatase A-like enzyme
VRFTDAYATPLCSASRGAVMTGRYPERFQMYVAITKASQPDPKPETDADPYVKVLNPGSRSFLPPEETTVAEILRDAGYTTHFIGKWHLGAGKQYAPHNQGFDHVVVHGHAAAGYFSPYSWLPESFSSGPDGEYLTERFTDDAIRILRQEAKSDKPFFLALHHFNVHSPLQAKPEVIAKYEKLADPDNPQHNPVMAAMIEGLDDSVGRIMEELDRLKLADNTILVFASDNGGVGWPEKPGEPPATSNLPLRGWKGTLFEGGVRVPMLIRWPGAARPGLICETPVMLCDLLPTLTAAAGTKPPEFIELDGMDLRPALMGESIERDSPLLFYFPISFAVNGARPAAAVRDGEWKLIRFFGEGPDQTDKHELYNLETDIGETTDVSGKHPERVKTLAAKLDAELKRIGARIPQPNPNHRPHAPVPRQWRDKLQNP